MRKTFVLLLTSTALAALALVAVAPSHSQPPRQSSAATLEAEFHDKVQPFVATYCAKCHGGEKPKGDLNLESFKSAAEVAKDLRHWESVLEQIDMGTMPPSRAEKHPTEEGRREIVAWIRSLRREEGTRHAGDPGPVPPRRLSNAEYDYTLRDLTGVDMRPAKEFPVDPANEAGFDNSAESLSMSPALLGKYLDAAQKISEYLLFKPDELAFAPYPVVADTDRDKYCTREILEFYQRFKTDYADFFQAAWRYQHREALGLKNATLADVATQEGVSAKYLANLYGVLTGPAEETGPIAALQILWRDMPESADQASKARKGAEAMRDLIVKIREKLVPEVKNLTAPGMDNGSQPLVYWKDRQMAANRTRYNGQAQKVKLENFGPTEASASALTAPAEGETLEKYEASCTRFCAVFPDTFLISERARVYLNPSGEKKLTGRFLSAGLHSQTGYFRDDGPLYDLILSEAEQKELDRLWLEFDAVTGAPMRQFTSMLWFERSDSSFLRSDEFNFVRADHDVYSEAKITKLSDLWVQKAKKLKASGTALQAFKDHFEILSGQIRRVERTRLEAEPKHLVSLQKLAEKAFRRPLTQEEREHVTTFYRRLREKDALGHEDAVRDTLVSILVSPHFLFLGEQGAPLAGAAQDAPKEETKTAVEPLSEYALASRLSYFLWCSMPDEELLAKAATGELHKTDVLRAQVKRMLADDHIRNMATEFEGNWLDFRRFEEHNAVDRARFKTFTDDLRKAMFDEPIVFFVDVIRSDRNVYDFLYAHDTFVNPVLAKHYGMPVAKSAPADKWVKVDNAEDYGRGGLLPMAVFLTKNAPGLRTSPVKRGYWVVRRLLGEKIPSPPPEVPQIPSDETKLGDLTLRETLEKHRADKSCAACHARFDALGLVFEDFGPVGERRTLDLAGRPVDTKATFPGGDEGTGVEGLRAYIKGHRQDDFLDNLCRKFLAFSLSRTLIPSDDLLIDEMKKQLAAHDYRFDTMIDVIATSPQFLNRRVGEGS